MGYTRKSSGSITAQNTGIDAMDVTNALSISISGTWVATVYLQRKHDGTNWRDVTSYTANIEDTIEDPVGAQYRLFVKTGGFTSGTVECLLLADNAV